MYWSTLKQAGAMKKRNIFVIVAAVALFTGVFAQSGNVPVSTGSAADSAAAAPRQITPPPQQQSLNKQAGVQRPTKRTNWSKIKNLFE